MENLEQPGVLAESGDLWRIVSLAVSVLSRWHTMLLQQQMEIVRGEATRASAGPGTGPKRVKPPVPEKFDGRKGDTAMGLMAACNNFREMDPDAFASDTVAIRWALQLLMGNSNAWKVHQMSQIDEEKDVRGRPPREFRDWELFWRYFLAQFGDTSLVDKARWKWREGIEQKGRAVNYFEEVEACLLRLGYGRNDQMVLDQVYLGLKEQVKTHFIGRHWQSLNKMKEVVIPYDASLFQIQ